VGRVWVGDLGQSGAQEVVVGVGEQQRLPEAGVGDLVAAGAWDARDEPVGTQTAQVVGHFPGGDVLGCLSEEGRDEGLTPAEARGHRPLRLATAPRPELPIHVAALGPAAVALAGQLADGWYPFLLPVSALKERSRRLEEGAAVSGQARGVPRISPCIPVAVSPDPIAARAVASWWVAFYLTSMGPLYRRTLRRLGFGAAVDDVLAANPTHRTTEVPSSAEVLLDELTVWGGSGASGPLVCGRRPVAGSGAAAEPPDGGTRPHPGVPAVVGAAQRLTGPAPGGANVLPDRSG